MRRFLILLLSLFLIGINSDNIACAQDLQQPAETPQNQDLQQVNALIKDYLDYSNLHDLDKLQKLYADNYFSGDDLNKQQLISLMKDTWDNYPGIKYSSVIKDIRITDNLAAVESFDKACGETIKKSDITDDAGMLNSDSHDILYLQRFGKDWKIVSDRVMYEKTIIKYGTAKTINVDFHAPEQVNAGDNYTGTLQVETPKGMICLGSITREPIVYPQTKPEEIFRQIPPDSDELERVMKANTTNNNELTSASAGFTEIVENKNANVDIKLTGIAVVLQRVNVVPKSAYVQEPEKAKVYTDTEADEVNNLPGKLHIKEHSGDK